MIAFVLVGVRLGELTHGPVETVRLAEIGSDRNPVPGACMRSGQCPSADLPVARHGFEVGVLHFHRALPVAELADVEIPVHVVDAVDPLPAQEDVAAGLHESLAGDDTLTFVRVVALTSDGCEHRGPGLLRLQEERIAVVTAEHEQDPAPRPDTADADDLASDVDALVPLDQLAP